MTNAELDHPALSWQRLTPRVEVAGLCNEVIGGSDCYGNVIDLSPSGLRIERPLRGRGLEARVQLEIDVPEIDEVLWVLGEVCFDRVHHAGAPGLLRTTGFRIAAAASRELRLLRDYVFDRSLAEERALRALQ